LRVSSLLLDEADKIKLDPHRHAVTPISKDRATRYLASRMCLDMYATMSMVNLCRRGSAPLRLRAEVCHHLQVVSTAPNHDYTTVLAIGEYFVLSPHVNAPTADRNSIRLSYPYECSAFWTLQIVGRRLHE
jgi:hypothetical protein